MKLIIIGLITAAFFSAYSCKTQGSVEKEPLTLKTEQDSASYAIGLQMAYGLTQQGLGEELKVEYILEGIKDQFDGETQLKIEDTDALLQKFFAEIQRKSSEDVVARGEDFLKENAEKDGVVTLPSGLQYKVIEEGDGPTPTERSTVKTHYEGRLIDGTVFDSSYQRGEPTSFPVNRVIAGWTEALQLMSVGSKWELYIPYHLAYGEQGAGQIIGPYETLIFKIELLDIVD